MGVKKIIENEVTYDLLFTEELDQIILHFGNDTERDAKIIESFSKSFTKRLTNDVMTFWLKYPYHPVNVVPIKLLEDIMDLSNTNQLVMLFKELGLLLPTKDRKKSKEYHFNRFLHHYHLSHVQRNTVTSLKHIIQDDIKMCFELFESFDNKNGEDLPEEQLEIVLRALMSNGGILVILWIAREIIESQKFEKWLISKVPTFYIMALAQAAYYTKKIDLEKIMVKPQSQVFNSAEVELANLRKEKNRLTKQLQKESNNSSNLQKEIFKLKRENKKITADIREIYEMNEQDKQVHLAEMENLQSYYLTVIEQLTADLEGTDVSTEDGTESFDMDLQGLKIAVIGGSRERHFRELINKNNGEMLFVSEDDFNKIEGAVRKADVVFYLKEVVGHHFFREAYPLSKKYAVPFIYINTLGVSTFKRELEKLIS